MHRPKPFDAEVAKQDLAMAQLTETHGWQVLRAAIADKREHALRDLLRAPNAIDPPTLEGLFALIGQVNAYDTVLALPQALADAAIAERKKPRQEVTA